MQLVWFILLIGILVTVHELGHFALAKLFDVKVLRLSFGFGPRLFGLRRGETDYAVSVVPIGGYVKLLGEDPSNEIAPEERGRAFPHKPLWQRLLIVLAGPAANLVFPSIIYFHFFAAEETTRAAVVGTVFAGQPAHGVLLPGDRIIAVDDAPVRSWDDMNRRITASPGRELRIAFERPGEKEPIQRAITPRAHELHDVLGSARRVGMIGVAPSFQLAQIGVADAEAPTLDGRSPAARAGLRTFDVITAVQGRPVETWHDLERVLRQNRGEALLVTYLRRQAGAPGWSALSRLEPGTAQVFPVRVVDPKTGRASYDAGIRPGELFLQEVEPGTPAAQIGLRPGDMIASLDGQPVQHWALLEQVFEERRDRELVLGWRTPTGEARTASLRLQPRTERDEFQTDTTHWVFGATPCRAVRAGPDIPIEGRLSWAMGRALETTASVTVTMVRVLGHLLVGKLPVSAVGGPIMIFHLAGVAGARGGDEFLAMAALVSLNLGLLNLLPVPLLDGGHLVFFAVEGLRKRPVSRRTRERATWVGIAVLGALMILALSNDILRFWLR